MWNMSMYTGYTFSGFIETEAFQSIPQLWYFKLHNLMIKTTNNIMQFHT